MPVETAADVYAGIDVRVVETRRIELDRKTERWIKVAGSINEIRARMLTSGKEDSRVSLALREQVNNAWQRLGEQYARVNSFSARHKAFLEDAGLAGVVLSPELKLPEIEVIPIEKPVKKEKRGHSKWEPVVFEVDGVELTLTGTEKAVMEALVRARANSGGRMIDLARAAFPHYPESKLGDAVKHLGVVISNLRRQKLPNTGLNIVHVKPTIRGESGKYYLSHGEGFVSPTPTDGYRSDNGLDDTENVQGELTLTDEEIVILGHALYFAYSRFQNNGRMNSFGIVITHDMAQALTEEVTRNERVDLKDPRFNLNEIFPGIVRKMTHPDERVIQAQNDERVAILLRIFANLRKTEGEATIKRKLEDILGNYRRALEAVVKK